LALENRRVIGDLRLDSCPIMRAPLRAEGAPRVPEEGSVIRVIDPSKTFEFVPSPC
jgi:hypothetical protein